MKEYHGICKFCKESFTTKTKNRKYCSKSCKMKQYRQDEKNNIVKSRICEICGKSYFPKLYRRTTCSKSCASQKNHDTSKEKESEYRSTKCPTCGKIYERKYKPPFSGIGIPRIRCYDCNEYVTKLNYETFESNMCCV